MRAFYSTFSHLQFGVSFFLFSCWIVTYAQPSYLVHDFSQDTSEASSSNISSFMVYDGKVFFGSDYGTSKFQYYDPQTGMVHPLLDFQRRGGTPNGDYVIYQNRLLFNLFTYGNGAKVWVSDGTTANTSILNLSNSFGNVSFFPLTSGIICCSPDEIWMTDGTEVNSNLIFQGSNDHQLSFLNGLVFLSEQNHLWFTDGSLEGTQQLFSDSVETPQFRQPLIVKAESLFFIYNHPSEGEQLWVSNGSQDGTISVFDPGAGDNYDLKFQGKNHLFVFFEMNTPGVGRELWRSDGTQAGTGLVLDINQGISNSYPVGVATLGDYFLFTVSLPNYEGALMCTDGTSSGTHELIHYSDATIDRESFTVLEDRGVFTMESEQHGAELWITDGTIEGTHLMVDLLPGEESSNPTNLNNIDGKVWFTATGPDETSGIYTTDGTPEGTECLASGLNVTWARPFSGGFAYWNHIVYFSMTQSEGGPELWESDGTPEGTRRVWHQDPGAWSDSDNVQLWEWDNALYGSHNYGQRMFWKAVDEPIPPTQIYPAYISSHQNGGVKGLFLSSEGTLFETDGTPQGTKPRFFSVKWYAEMGDYVYVAFYSGLHRYHKDSWEGGIIFEPHPYDGLFLNKQSFSSPTMGLFFFLLYSDSPNSKLNLFLLKESGELTLLHRFDYEYSLAFPDNALDDVLVFSGFMEEQGFELWRTDGTTEGTYLLKDYLPGEPSSRPGPFFRFNDHIYFSAEDEEHGRELWVSDGTPQGTYLIKDILPGPESGLQYGNYSNFPAEFLSYEGRFYFPATDLSHGWEFWQSDGTESGTELAFEASPGVESSEPYSMIVYDNDIFFVGQTLETGSELFRSDGTQAGTHLVEDLIPGPESSSPSDLIVVGDTLWYFAREGIEGKELRALRAIPRAGFSYSADLCQLAENRTSTAIEPNPGAQFAWSLSGGTIQSGQGSRTLTYSVSNSDNVVMDLITTTADQSILFSTTIPAVSGEPAQPDSINGDALVCQYEQGVVYDINPVDQTSTYDWTVPEDACILEGQGTDSIRVDFGQYPGDITVSARNDCGASPPELLPISFVSVNVPADAGPDQVRCDTQTQLQGSPVAPGSGTWGILAGTDGTIHEPLSPTSLFSGLAGESYVLEWVVDNGPCETTSSTVSISFLSIPDPADAGPDQFMCETVTTLSANQPELTQGRWEILAGEGGHLTQLSDPQAEFSGQPGEIYTLRWTLWSAPCVDTYDDVVLSLEDLITAQAGENRCALLGESVNLNAGGTPGTWSIVDGPDTSPSQLSDPNDPHTSFLAAGGPGTYQLRWMTQPDQCNAQMDTMTVDVVTSVFTQEIVVEESYADEEHDIGPYFVSNLVSSDGLAFFSANGSLAGPELWRSDGTAEGTSLIADYIPGLTGGSPKHLISHDDIHYFEIVQDEIHSIVSYHALTGQIHQVFSEVDSPIMLLPFHGGVIFSFNQEPQRLWKTNGTHSGTGQLMVLPIAAGRPEMPVGVGMKNGKSLFVYSGQLWSTDGTAPGTIAFLDFQYPVYNISPYGDPLDDVLFFLLDYSLWRTDGSAEGTYSLQVQYPSGPGMVFKDMLYFPSSSGEPLGSELWRSDGTVQGTVLVTDIQPGAVGTSPILHGIVDGKLLFSTGHGLPGTWVTDGTPTGVEQIHNFSFEDGISMGDYILLLETGFSQEGIYRSDGTAEGTQFVVSWEPDAWAKAGDHVLVLRAGNLSRTDGTPEGSHLLIQPQINQYLDFWSGLKTIGDKLVFVRDGAPNELWASDGTVGETSLLAQTSFSINPISSSQEPDFFFSKPSEAIWRSNGTPEGTAVYLDTTGMGFSEITSCLAIEDRVFFAASTSNGWAIWSSDGTPAQTTRLSEFFGGEDHFFRDLILFQGHLFIEAYRSHFTSPLWRIHPDSGETLEIKPSSELPDPNSLKMTEDESKLFLLSNKIPSSNIRLFVSNGTPEGTHSLAQLTNGSFRSFNFEVCGNLAFCQKYDGQIIRSDGTPEGTFSILQFEQDISSQIIPTGLDNGAYITVHDPSSADEIWYSDGTLEGTILLRRMPLNNGIPETIGPATAMDGSLYFSSTHGGDEISMQGMKNGCTWELGLSFDHSSGYQHHTFVAAESKLFLYRRDAQSKHQIVSYHPPLRMPRDPQLRRRVIQQFDSNSDTVIDRHEMPWIRELSLSGLGIKTIEGLESYQNLELLDLSHNRIEDVSPLVKMVQNPHVDLEHVNLNHNILKPESCQDLSTLIGIMGTRGLDFRDQGGISFTPGWDEWPLFHINHFLSDVTVSPYKLSCEGGAQ